MARCGASSVLGTVFDFAAMVLFVEAFALAYAPAAAASAAVGAVACFTVNRRWVFRDTRPLRLAQVAWFGAVAVGTAFVNAGVVHLLAGVLHVPYLLAKAASACVVFVTWSYPAQSRLVFAPTRLTDHGAHHA